MEINNSRPTQKQDENSQLKEENSRLKEENSQLKEENSQLKEENTQLKEENTQLKKEKSQLKEKNQRRKNEMEWLFKRNEQLDDKNWKLGLEGACARSLFERNKQLNNKNCHQDCVLCTIVWACGTKKLGLKGVCARALEKAIYLHASKTREINENDLKCEQLMAILQECGVVTSVGEFEYPSKSEAIARNKMINNAWDTLMKIDDDEVVVILGRRPVEANRPGHVEACELETRVDGKVKIYDPQQGVFSFQGDKEDFRDYVKDDMQRALTIYCRMAETSRHNKEK